MSARRLSTVGRATGRWSEILPQLGIASRFLTNRHGPCPLCGGKDRFRFDDRNGSGSYFCNRCGAGTGLILVRKLHEWDHRTACEAVDAIIGTDAKPRPQSTRASDPEGRRRALERVLSEARSPQIVTEYLRYRGLAVTSDVLRGHPSLLIAEIR